MVRRDKLKILSLESMLVSVIVPTYNSTEEQLSKTLLSVRSQTYDKIEIIVIDDGSEIPFAGLDRRPEYQDERIQWCRLTKNRGVACARNEGVRKSLGDALAFLDCGDWWEPEKIEQQAVALEEGKGFHSVVFSGAILHGGEKKKHFRAVKYDSYYKALLLTQPISGSASSVIVRKEAFESVGGFYEGHDIPEDRDLWLRLSREYSFTPIDSYTVHIDGNHKGRSADPEKKKHTYWRFLRMHEDEIRQARLWKSALFNYRRGIAAKFFIKGNFLKTVLWLGIGFVEAPMEGCGWLRSKVWRLAERNS